MNSNISVFDPKAMGNARAILGDKVSYANSALDACKDAELVVILTEWPEFGKIDLSQLKSVMKMPKILDLRNMLDAKTAQDLGFTYSCIGKRG